MTRRFIYLAKLGIIESNDSQNKYQIQRIDNPKDFQLENDLDFEPPFLESDEEADELFNSISEEMFENLNIEGIEGQIIDKAREIVSTDFMQYPDYDSSIPTSLSDALTIIVSQHLEDVDTAEIYDCLDKAELNNLITPELKKAFDHVKTFFPDLSIVVIDIFGKWNYMDADFKAFDFSSVDIDVSILEKGADSIQNTPFVYQEYENED